MKTKWLLGLPFLVAIVIAVIILFSGWGVKPVDACHTTITGVPVCLVDGTQKITWTISNSETGSIETITAIDRSIGIAVGSLIPKGGSVTGSEIVSGSMTGVVSLKVTGTWPGTGAVTNTGSITLPGGCTPKKVYVCKYVGTPGVDERLQNGNNPIEVSINAIPDFPGVGAYFGDAHERSYVLGYVPMVPEPTKADCPAPPPVPGCMDPVALNYNPSATVDNGSCEYPPPPVPGCMDEKALNYNPLATVDNGSCEYPPPPPPTCVAPKVMNSEGECVLPPKPVVPGCSDCTGTLTWEEMYPKENQLVQLFHLADKCVWTWDKGVWCNNTDANQVDARVSLKPFTVIWEGYYHPSRQEGSVWVLSDIGDRLQGITINGIYSGPFSWTDWPKLTRTADAGQKLKKYFVCSVPTWTNAGNVADWFRPYSELQKEK